MLAVSRGLNPGCEHVLGDMRSLRLGRTFDAVFVHDAVVYMTTESDLSAAIATAFAHTRPGGVALFAPDYTREMFEPGTDHGGHDSPDGRSLRYLEWTHDLEPGASTYEVDYVVLLHETGKPPRVEADHHVEGLFSEATWLHLLEQVGFSPLLSAAEPGVEDAEQPVFVGRKTVTTSA